MDGTGCVLLNSGGDASSQNSEAQLLLSWYETAMSTMSREPEAHQHHLPCHRRKQRQTDVQAEDRLCLREPERQKKAEGVDGRREDDAEVSEPAETPPPS